jgi:hypothetical protein
VLGVLAALFAAALYLPTIQYGWVWDDSFLVASQGAAGVGAEGFRPLVSILYRLEWAIGYGTPVISHLMNISLHVLATWLFFTLALHLGAGSWIAFSAAALFAAHPIHVEAVAYVSGRPDLLATVLVLASLLLARTRELCSPEGCRSWKIWFAYAALVGALLADEVAIVTPLLLIAMDRWGPEPVPWKQRRTHVAGFFAFVLVYLLVRFTTHGGAPVTGSAHDVSGIDPAVRGWAPLMNFFTLLAAMVAPYPLHAMRTLTTGGRGDVGRATRTVRRPRDDRGLRGRTASRSARSCGSGVPPPPHDPGDSIAAVRRVVRRGPRGVSPLRRILPPRGLAPHLGRGAPPSVAPRRSGRGTRARGAGGGRGRRSASRRGGRT